MPTKKFKRPSEEDEEEESEEEEEIEATEEIEDEEPEPEEEMQQIKKAVSKSMPKSKDTPGRFRMVEVPVQMTPAFEDTQTQKIYDQNLLLLKIANDIEDIKISVA